jgi:hypothetical protein
MKSLTAVCLALATSSALAAETTPAASMQHVFASHEHGNVSVLHGNDPAKTDAVLSIVGPDYFCLKDEPAAAAKCYPFSNVYWFESLADHSMVLSLRQP